ncbi:MAG: TonB-dependent receptor plug domain-containing protein [Gammaproteobacteria bacterium]
MDVNNSPVKLIKPLLYFYLILLANISLTFGAELMVEVKEKGTGTLLQDATVVLDDGETYRQTDQSGRVRFDDIKSSQSIKILSPGYETYTQSIARDQQQMTVYITPLMIESEGLEVTASRIIETISKVSLSNQELSSTPGSQGDPIKAITTLPGIISTGEDSSSVYIRGSDQNDNIVWVNRAPVGYLYHFGGFYSTINASLIEDINIFLGGFPVEYGNALGGVIDVKLRKPENDRMHYRFDISTISSSFLAEGPVNEAGGDSFFLSARRSYIDLLFSPDEFNDSFEDDEDEDPDQITLVPRFYDTQALYHQLLDQGHIDYYLFTAGDELEADIRDSALSDPQLAGRLHSQQRFVTSGLNWEQSWSNRLSHTMTLAYYHNETEFALGSDDSGEPFFVDASSDTLLWQPELRWKFDMRQQVNLGIAASYSKIPLDLYISRLPDENDPDFDFTTQDKYRINTTLYAHNYSPYVKVRQQWTDTLTTSIGLLYSDISVTGGFQAQEWSPRLSLEYQASNRLLLSASWGRYVQMPQGTEIVEDYGNPGLLMTQSEHRILGLEYQLNPLYSLKTEIYHKPMKDLVIAIDGSPPPDNYSNEASGEAYGIDIFIKRVPRHRKIGWLALSWGKTERTNELTGLTRDFSGDQPLTLSAVWGQPFRGGSWKRWDWSMKTEVHSGTPYTEITGRHQEDPFDPDSRWIAEYGTHNAERTPVYYKIDLRIAREILMKESKLKIYLDLQNITFRENVVSYDYGNEYEKVDNPTEVTGMSFFPFFGVEINF